MSHLLPRRTFASSGGRQHTGNLTARGLETIRSLDHWAGTTLARHLRNSDTCWQPHDFLPDASSDGFFDQVRDLRAASSGLPDDYLVVLVGDMVTEEALPSYMNIMNRLDGVKDETGAQVRPARGEQRFAAGPERNQLNPRFRLRSL